MEVLHNKKNLFYEILYDDECLLLKKDLKEIKNKVLLAPTSGVVKKIDSNNTEIIIKSFEGEMIFLYLNEGFIKESILSFVKEGDLIFKGQPILNISCGYDERDLIILIIKN